MRPHIWIKEKGKWVKYVRVENVGYGENPSTKGPPMSEFETLHAQLAENLEKRKTITRQIAQVKKDNRKAYVLPDHAVDQITDWQFDLFILHKEANRIMRKMFKIESSQGAEVPDLSTD